jgi:hypothetical protein
MSQLTEFYRGAGTDSEGRTLAGIWAYSDADLESIHDFIQWLFPLRERSRFNPDAPLLTDADIEQFRTDAKLRENLARSFEVFLAFLGLRYQEGRVTRAVDFDKKMPVWRYPNHNWLRITRVLTSTRLLGLEEQSRAFFDFLKDLRDSGRSGITADTFGYWEQAAHGSTGPYS